MNHSVVTPWTSAENLVKQLHIGDCVEVRRVRENKTQIATHWVVYMGLYNEIHLVGHISGCDNNRPSLLNNLFSSDTSSDGNKSPVGIENFLDIFGNDETRINNLMDKYCEPLPGEDIYERFKNRIDDNEYSAVTTNCEYFAKLARYDIDISEQVNVGNDIMIGMKTLFISKSLLRASGASLMGYLALETYDFFKKRLFVDSSSI
uniref:LRAT domain-containing protein n=1 Tax=Strongyloides papillosus TaxID=174720 RepID=A0A0N5BZ15_STREA